MKKLVLSLGLLAGAAGAAQAQTAGFGIKAGVGLSDVVGSDVGTTTKNLFGFQAGVMGEVGGEHFAFHPELLYSQKGAKYEDSDYYTVGSSTYTSATSGKVRIAYLDIPLLLRAKAAGAFFEVGPQLGVLLSQQNDYTTTNTTTSTGGGTVVSSRSSSDNSTNGVRKLDVGYVLGLGYRLPQGLELALRYNGGLTSLDDSSSPAKARNSVFQLQLGYLFGSK